MTSRDGWTRLRVAAFFSLALHAAGLVVSLFGIRNGTAVFEPEPRMAFVATSLLGWKVAWGVWLLAALAFVWFLASVESVWNAAGVRARLSMIVGVVAAALDCVFDTLQIAVLPAIAGRGPESRVFLGFAAFAGTEGIVVANGLYAIAVALMTAALSDRLSQLQRVLGWIVLATGLLLSATGFSDNPHWAELCAGPAIGSYMLWVAALAWYGPRGETDSTAWPDRRSGSA